MISLDFFYIYTDANPSTNQKLVSLCEKLHKAGKQPIIRPLSALKNKTKK